MTAYLFLAASGAEEPVQTLDKLRKAILWLIPAVRKIYEGDSVLPIQGGAFDMLPVILMVLFLTMGAVGMRLIGREKWLRRLVLAVSLPAFAVTVLLCVVFASSLPAGEGDLSLGGVLLLSAMCLSGVFILAMMVLALGRSQREGAFRWMAHGLVFLAAVMGIAWLAKTVEANEQYPYTASIFFASLTAAIGARALSKGAWHHAYRRTIQTLSTFAFIAGIHPCFCMIRNAIKGVKEISADDLYAFSMVILFGTVVAFQFVFGRVFCGYICPVGLIEELIAKTTGWTKRFDPRHVRIGKYIAALLLVVILVAGVGFMRPANAVVTQGLMAFWAIGLAVMVMFVTADPKMDTWLKKVRYVSIAAVVMTYAFRRYFSMPGCYFYTSENDFASILALFGLFAAAPIVMMAWCRYLCPDGAVFMLFHGKSFYQIEKNNNCIECNKCGENCYTDAIYNGDRDASSCLLCGKCIEVCPVDALEYKQRACVGRSIERLAMPSEENAS